MFKKMVVGVLICTFSFAVSAGESGVRLEKIFHTMIKDGSLETDCARTAKNAKDLISAEPIILRKSGVDYLVTGQDCACVGARVCNQWIYQLNGENFRLIFGPSQADGISPRKSYTNQYKDILETYLSSGGWNGFYKFDGRRYQLMKKK